MTVTNFDETLIVYLLVCLIYVGLLFVHDEFIINITYGLFNNLKICGDSSSRRVSLAFLWLLAVYKTTIRYSGLKRKGFIR